MPSAARQPQRSYLVCATPRSGSTLLCEGLKRTGVAGRPAEYFETLASTGLTRRPTEYFEGVENPQIARALPDAMELNGWLEPPSEWSPERYGDYLRSVIERATTPNGVFGAKLMWGYFDDFVTLMHAVPEFRALAAPKLLPAAFPDVRYVLVKRERKARQAVSLWKVLQTFVWRQERRRGDLGPRPRNEELLYCFEAIDHLERQLSDHEAAWEDYFDRADIQPLTLVYEEFASDVQGAVAAVLDHLDVPVPAGFSLPREPLRRQADDHSEEWVRRYREERARVRAR